MVTIEELLPYSYWIGHPVTNRAIVYLFVGFVPLRLTSMCSAVRISRIQGPEDY